MFTHLLKLRKLTFTILSGNNICKDGCKEIGKGLEHLIHLEDLKISIDYDNKLSADGIAYLS